MSEPTFLKIWEAAKCTNFSPLNGRIAGASYFVCHKPYLPADVLAFKRLATKGELRAARKAYNKAKKEVER
jgi:hypothetical protein